MSIEQVIKRWRRLKGERSSWNSHYEDLARIMLPRRLGFTSTTNPGERRNDNIYDGTPMLAARGLANAIGGMLRPDGNSISTMVAENDELNDIGEVQDWLGDSQERLRNGIDNPKARHRQATGETDIDLVVFGTACLFVGDLTQNLIYQSVHLKDALVVFNEHGVAEGIFRSRSMPIYQLVNQFGMEKLSESVRETAKTNQDQKIEVLHAVLPNEKGRSDALLAKNLPYSDLWIEIDQKHTLHESGYHEFPFMVPRWDTSSGEDYGRSPGMIALPDGETLQAMGETILIAGQRAADPALAVPNDGAFSAINTFPGGLSYYDVETAAAVGGNPMFEIGTGANLPISRDMQADTRDQIFAAFFRNVLNLPTQGPQMTAYEVMQRKEELIREIGPVFGRLETDYTAPKEERSFMIMLRGGAFLPIPEVLQGENLKFEYESPVKKIRKQIEAQAAKMWAAEQIEFSEFDRTALHLVNFEELGRHSAEAVGVPNKIVNSQEVVTAIKEAEQQAAQEEAEKEMLGNMLEVADRTADVGQKINQAQAVSQ